MSRSSTPNVPRRALRRHVDVPVPASGAVATKNTGCRSNHAASLSSIVQHLAHATTVAKRISRDAPLAVPARQRSPPDTARSRRSVARRTSSVATMSSRSPGLSRVPARRPRTAAEDEQGDVGPGGRTSSLM